MAQEILERIHQLELKQERMDAQTGRLVSDAESEKGTRERANSEIWHYLRKMEERLREVEKRIWMGLGALAALEIVLKYTSK